MKAKDLAYLTTPRNRVNPGNLGSSIIPAGTGDEVSDIDESENIRSDPEAIAPHLPMSINPLEVTMGGDEIEMGSGNVNINPGTGSGARWR